MMKTPEEIVNNLDLEFDSEINREYYNKVITEAIKQIQTDIMDKQIIIEIKGGIVEAVTTNFECKYMVLDYDNSDIEYTIYEPDEVLLDQDIFEV